MSGYQTAMHKKNYFIDICSPLFGSGTKFFLFLRIGVCGGSLPMSKIVLPLISLFLANFTLVAVQVGSDGSANYSIPIKTMSGINGLEPKLSINYNSNAPNGMLGVGFQLQGLPIITRVNNGRGINYDANDTFAGPGGKLILVDSVNRIYHSENTDWVEYIPYTNNTTKWSGSGGCGNGPCFWKAYTTHGKILEFGKDYGRVKKVGSSAVRVWGISKVEDTYGNYYTVKYLIDNVNGDYYPSYINQSLKGSSGLFAKAHKVKFLLGSKTDVTTSYTQNIANNRLRPWYFENLDDRFF